MGKDRPVDDQQTCYSDFTFVDDWQHVDPRRAFDSTRPRIGLQGSGNDGDV